MFSSTNLTIVSHATIFNFTETKKISIEATLRWRASVPNSGRRDFSRWKSAGTRNHRRNWQFHRVELKQSREMIDLPSRCRYVRSPERKKRKRKKRGEKIVSIVRDVLHPTADSLIDSRSVLERVQWISAFQACINVILAENGWLFHNFSWICRVK